MGDWGYNPTYMGYKSIYNWLGFALCSPWLMDVWGSLTRCFNHQRWGHFHRATFAHPLTKALGLLHWKKERNKNRRGGVMWWFGVWKIRPDIGLDFDITLAETNIAPENRSSQKETSIPTIHFQVLC